MSENYSNPKPGNYVNQETSLDFESESMQIEVEEMYRALTEPTADAPVTLSEMHEIIDLDGL